jgi:hypothetical protein
MTHDEGGFRKVLDLCDALSDLKERSNRRKGDAGDAGNELAAEKRARLSELWDHLNAAFTRGGLGELRDRFSLTRDELLVTALLLSRRIRKGARGLSGRAILSMIYDSAYDMLRGMEILGVEGNLRRSGVVVAAAPQRDDVLESVFRLSDDMFYMIVDEIDDKDVRAGGELAAYSSAREHLIDMGRLTSLYRKRAALLFPVEAQDFFSVGGGSSLEEIGYRIEAAWSDIEDRLLLTERYEEFPLVRLERMHALSREELIIVVSLFFVELISPAPYLIVGDLVKLVSRHEEDLMANRRLLTRDASLVKSGIIILDEEHGVHGKLTTFDGYLADWVVEKLAGPRRDMSAITSDMQIEVHEFLKGLSRSRERD